jgi:hypothetical protein
VRLGTTIINLVPSGFSANFVMWPKKTFSHGYIPRHERFFQKMNPSIFLTTYWNLDKTLAFWGDLGKSVA